MSLYFQAGTSSPPGRLLRTALAAAILIILSGCASTPDLPPEEVSALVPRGDLRGVASWYGNPYHGRKTSNGEIYNMHGATAAHRTLPFNSRVRVERLDNGNFVDVRINDRGPFVKGRVIDLSRGAADQLSMLSKGVARVRLIPLRVPQKKAIRWLVLVGGFENRNDAKTFSIHLRDRAPRTRIIRGWHGSAAQYRVQLDGFRTRRPATELTLFLQEKGYEAFLVRVG